jgi:predicted Kef-type K+ transport protein
MLERLKLALVNSYVGAIAVGWLAAQALTDVTSIIVAPVSAWVARRLSSGDTSFFRIPPSPSFPYWLAVPPLIRSTLLLLIAFFLIRWLYIEPVERDSARNSDPGETGLNPPQP